jgi:hypothetical protein
MIHSVDLSSDEVIVGQTFTIEVHADSPVEISIGCFVDKPPPPRFKGCRECSVQIVRSGQPFEVTPRKDTWRSDDGGYRIKVTDADGNSETVFVNVLGGTASAGGTVMGA